MFSENGQLFTVGDSVLLLQEMQGGFSFTLPKVITVIHHLLIYGGARACAGFAQPGVWEGGMGIGGEGR